MKSSCGECVFFSFFWILIMKIRCSFLFLFAIHRIPLALTEAEQCNFFSFLLLPHILHYDELSFVKWNSVLESDWMTFLFFYSFYFYLSIFRLFLLFVSVPRFHLWEIDDFIMDYVSREQETQHIFLKFIQPWIIFFIIIWKTNEKCVYLLRKFLQFFLRFDSCCSRSYAVCVCTWSSLMPRIQLNVDLARMTQLVFLRTEFWLDFHGKKKNFFLEYQDQDVLTILFFVIQKNWKYEKAQVVNRTSRNFSCIFGMK